MSVYRLDWPEDPEDPEAMLRYDYLGSGKFYSVVDRDEAYAMSQSEKFYHVGSHVPHRFSIAQFRATSRSVENATPAENASTDDGEWYALTFIEFCCRGDSRLGDTRYLRPGVRLVRLTEQWDMTSPDGVRAAV